MPHRAWPVLAALHVAGLGAALLAGRPSRAADDDAHHIVYLSVTGEGQTAKAWYKGSPPTGVPVQEALDTFARQGYHVSEVRPYERQTVVVVGADGNVPTLSAREDAFVVLLER